MNGQFARTLADTWASTSQGDIGRTTRIAVARYLGSPEVQALRAWSTRMREHHPTSSFRAAVELIAAAEQMTRQTAEPDHAAEPNREQMNRQTAKPD